jgi:hypothetical protein
VPSVKKKPPPNGEGLKTEHENRTPEGECKDS